MQKWVEKWAQQKIKKKKKPVPPPFSGLRRFTNMDRTLQPELFRGSDTSTAKDLEQPNRTLKSDLTFKQSQIK